MIRRDDAIELSKKREGEIHKKGSEENDPAENRVG